MGCQTQLQKIQEVRANRTNLGCWQALLEALPEGSELCIDDNGQVIGVHLQITFSFAEGNIEEALDNMSNHLGIATFQGKELWDASSQKTAGGEDPAS